MAPRERSAASANDYITLLPGSQKHRYDVGQYAETEDPTVDLIDSSGRKLMTFVGKDGTEPFFHQPIPCLGGEFNPCSD